MKNKSLPTKIGLIVGVLAMISGVALATVFVTGNRVSDLPGAGEQMIVDELSLWHQPANSGISYNAFEPVHVRDQGADYFHRTDPQFAASGKRFGEVRLHDKDGGILYLPRWLSYDQNDKLKVFLNQEKNQGHWRISIYSSADRVAHIDAQSPAATVTPSGNWVEVVISLSQLIYEQLPSKNIADADWRNPDKLLNEYKAPRGYLYGIGFSLVGGASGDRLYIDRLSLLKETHTAAHKLTGQLVPPILSRAEIILRSSAGEYRAKTGIFGGFEFQIPEGTEILEVVAQADDRVMSPRAGRFLEIGTYLPKIIIPTGDPVLHDTPKKGNVNDSIYVYEEKYGPRIEANEHFLIQVSVEDDQVMAGELAANRFGYIDRARRPENPDNAYRVMVMGDSHHMGVHLAEADSWWNEAEAVTTMMSERPVEVISASFHHASWTSSWPIFRDVGAELKPDLVLLPMMDPGILNLSIEEYVMDWLGASAGHRPAYQFELGADGKIVHKPNDADWQLYSEPFPEDAHKRVREQYVSNPYVHADPSQTPEWVKENIRLAVASLAEFSKLAKQRKTRFAILYLSNYGSSKTDLIVENGVTYDPNKFRDLMRNMAQEADVEFIDLSQEVHMTMMGKDADRMFYASNGHFTPYGHYRYGQALGNLVSSLVKAQ